ncbi:MAG TPA: hypothetical protein VM925_30440 [Labilithrix sp.]|nr:hypothetical protein [Labilithrix sp.]
MQRRIDHLLLAVVAMLAACSRGRAPESRRAAPPIAIHAVPRSAPDSAARVAENAAPSPSRADASADAATERTTRSPPRSDTRANPTIEEPVHGDIVCRLFDGCDGGPACVPNQGCQACFDADEVKDKEGCTDLYALNACESRGHGKSKKTYSRIVRACARVYRTPSKWP